LSSVGELFGIGIVEGDVKYIYENMLEIVEEQEVARRHLAK